MGKRIPIPLYKAEELIAYVERFGEKKAAKSYGMKMSSLKRRLREIRKSYGIVPKKEKSRVLVIGDLHEPFSKDGYLDFCLDTYEKYGCNQVIFIGDIMDNHYSSFHDTDPDGHSAAEEFRLAKERVATWYKQFPVAKVCIGNHDLIPDRKAFNAGLSNVWMKSIAEVLDVPDWDFRECFSIDNVKYVHGTARKARIRAKEDFGSVVQGHYHSESYIEYFVGDRFKFFAMQIGCGVDRDNYAMAYGKYYKKMHINVGVVLEGGQLPILEYMKLGE